MNEHDATEAAYKNGYSAGYAAGQDAVGDDTTESPDLGEKLYSYTPLTEDKESLHSAIDEIMSEARGLLEAAGDIEGDKELRTKLLMFSVRIESLCYLLKKSLKYLGEYGGDYEVENENET